MQELTLLTVPVFSTLCNLAFQLRREVFVLEQRVPPELENDADDLTAIHIVAIQNGDVCGTLRIVSRPEHHKIGRVAVGQAFRGRGIAKAMMLEAMDRYGDVAAGRFYLTAQTDKVSLYEKLGYKAFGQPFMDAGIPHLSMKNY